MTDRRTARFTAFALALFLTLSIFSGVSGLAAPEHASPLLAKAMQSKAPQA